MELDDRLCSRNARSQKALVEGAQWKINQPSFLKRERANLEGSSVTSLDGRSGISTGAIPGNVTRVSLEGLCRKIVRVRSVMSPLPFLLSQHRGYLR